MCLDVTSVLADPYVMGVKVSDDRYPKGNDDQSYKRDYNVLIDCQRGDSHSSGGLGNGFSPGLLLFMPIVVPNPQYRNLECLPT